MRHPAEREQLLTIIADLLRFQLLDPAGGAVSLRLSTGDILMSTTGSAFRRWNITPDDFILLTPDGGRRRSPRPAPKETDMDRGGGARAGRADRHRNRRIDLRPVQDAGVRRRDQRRPPRPGDQGRPALSRANRPHPPIAWPRPG